MNLGLSYESVPSTSDPISTDFRTTKPREDLLYSDKSYDYGLPQSNQDISKSYTTKSYSSSVMSSSYQSYQPSVYPSDVQSTSSMFYPSSSAGHSEDLMPISDTTRSGLLPSDSSSRTPPSTVGLSINQPSYSSSYSASSSTGASSFPFQLLSLDFLSPDYTPGPLTMAANVLTASSSPTSTELSSFNLDILDSDLKTPPITTSMQTLSGPFSMSTSMSMHHSQSYGSVIDTQATSTNIFDTGVPAVTTAPSTSSSSIIQSDVWRPY